MGESVRKGEVEQLLGCEITDGQFNKALVYAKRKQEYIHSQEHSAVALQRWYLVKLTEEYARNLAFSKFTMDLCSFLRDMEKEHSANCQSAPTDIHIVAGSVL